MAEKIFLIDGDGHLRTMEEQPYDREDVLQDLLARYPDLIPGDQIDSDDPRRWILVKREMQVPDDETSGGRWSLDHLFLDQNGIPTLVETKRSSDTRLRREVLGQMLDYAANSVVYWSAETVRSLFEQRCERDDSEPAQELSRIGVRDAEEFWRSVKTNLEAKRLRLVFIADIIPRELKRIIEFLNEQMSTVEVIGVEVRQFVGADRRKTIVPRVVGQTEKAQQRKRGGQRTTVRWTADTFLTKIAERSGQDAAEVAARLLRWIDEHADRAIWNNSERGSFVATIDIDDQPHFIFTVTGDGGVKIPFMWEKRRPPFDDPAKRQEWLARINRIDSVEFPPKAADGKPTIPLAALRTDASFQSFGETSRWVIDEIRRAPQ